MRTSRTSPPFEEISNIVEYLEDKGELDNFCAAIRQDTDRNHIYVSIRRVQYWLSTCSEYDARPELARTRVADANKQISEAVEQRPSLRLKRDRQLSSPGQPVST
jgi:hypothetical protein